MSETPHQAAQRFAASQVRRGYVFQALHEYTDPDGNPLHWRIRLKHPERRDKWIRPMKLDGDGFALAEPAYPDGKPLYRLRDLTVRPDDAVIVVEGESCADELVKVRGLATTSGGADSVGLADWAPLARRTVFIWPDNDEAGQRFAEAVASTLLALGCVVRIIDVAPLGLPPKGDVVDWLAANPGATGADVLALANQFGTPVEAGSDEAMDELGWPPRDSGNSGEEEKQPSQASALVAFVEERATLFHDPNKDVYAQDRATGETRRLDSRQFRDWLVASYYSATGKSPRDQSVREALGTLAGLGRFHGERLPVHVRVAQLGETYFLDLAEAGQSRAIRIEAGRWEVVSDPPVRFVRPETLHPLPEPVRGGNLAALWDFANVPPNARLLVVAWLADCLRPDTPFPVLELIGEQGSAKSTTQAALRRLIDPNTCDLRAAPKVVEDIFVSAGVNWLVSYENMSHLSAPMQDALCVLATGGGFAKRKLYSDADEAVIVVKRPVVLNGISAAVTAQDLVDRSLSVETPVVRQRQDVTDLWREYEAAHGRLLGALLDVMAGALARLPQVQLPPEDRPRLVEFARFGMAIAEAMGRTGRAFMEEFQASRQESIARTLDASPVAVALIEWFDARQRRATSMTIKALYEAVDRYKPGGTDAWPRSPKGFGDAMRRAAPALRQIGIECRSLGKTGSYVSWEVKAREVSRNSSLGSLDVLDGEAAQQDIKTSKTWPAEVCTADLGGGVL